MSKSDIQYIFIPKASDDAEVAELLIALDRIPPHGIIGTVIDDSLINLEVYLPIERIPYDMYVRLTMNKDPDRILQFRNILAAFTIIAQNPGQDNIIETCLGQLSIVYKKVDNTPCIKLEYYGTPISVTDPKPLTARVKAIGKRKPMKYRDGRYIIIPINQSLTQIATMQLDYPTLTITINRGATRNLPDTLDCVVVDFPLENADGIRVIRTEFKYEYISSRDGTFCKVYQSISNEPIADTDIDINSVLF